MAPKYTNELIGETSPYLLQHAHNPVNWVAWDKSWLDIAEKENKLLLISIGYSACHWCHVMERESFEHEEVGEAMNAHYICIKIDREEHPDIDHYYMQSLMVMGQQGGWPLNIIATPDGKPVYGGTYFPKDKWLAVLDKIQSIWHQEPQKLRNYGNQLSHAVQSIETELPDYEELPEWGLNTHKAVKKLLSNADTQWGGQNHAPKFMVPVHLDFLLQYGTLLKDQEALAYVYNTLDHMATGSLFDHVEGGFTRYSVDMEWRVPHFEKMTYDNAQLIGLYADAHRASGNAFYLDIAEKTARFCLDQLQGPNGLFYCAYDADSEGEEGKYYTWTEQEITAVLEGEWETFCEHYCWGDSHTRNTLWEGKHLIIKQHAQAYTEQEKTLLSTLAKAKTGRVKPGLDNKQLLSWNGMMLTGLSKLALANPQHEWREAATALGNKLHGLAEYKHVLNKPNTEKVLLEDLVFLCEGYFTLFQVTQDPKWFKAAEQWLDHIFIHYGTSHAPYFVQNPDKSALAPVIEKMDSVTPSTNSTLAKLLYHLGRLSGNSSYYNRSLTMLHHQYGDISVHPYSFSNWGILCLYQGQNPGDLILSQSTKTENGIQQFYSQYHPGYTMIACHDVLPFTHQKEVRNNLDTYYFCRYGTCSEPSNNFKSFLPENN